MTDHQITTTMNPDRVVTVNDQELLDLTRMGVVGHVVTDTEEIDGRTEEARRVAQAVGGGPKEALEV